MEPMEIIQKRIEVATDLHSIVKTMKTLAAVSIRQYENTVAAIAEYQSTIELGLRIVLRKAPAVLREQKTKEDHRMGIIIFGSDQGLCGPFNERLAAFFLETLSKQQTRASVLAIGARIANQLENSGCPVEDCFPVPGSLSGFVPLVQKILLKMENMKSRLNLDQVYVFHNRPLNRATFRPIQLQLLPLNPEWFDQLAGKPWPTNNLAQFTMDSEKLFSSLIRQHVSVHLFRALAESMMSENASRMNAMQVAEKNIEERLGELNAQYRQERQDSITGELLEIISGFEAQTLDPPNF